MTTPVLEADLQKILAHQALHDLNMAYARAADRADAVLMASVFHDGATVVAGLFNGCAAQYAREVTAFICQHFTRCFHSVSNEWFDIRGDRAVGESYVIAAVTVDRKDVLTCGRYLDTFERRAATWKITRRLFVEEWSHAQPTSQEPNGLHTSPSMRGQFGSNDLVYSIW